MHIPDSIIAPENREFKRDPVHGNDSAHRFCVAYSSYGDLELYRQSAIGNRVHVPRNAECRMPWIDTNP